ncbi:MAG: hypothetical protein IJW72_07280 [Alphaproteobacteria bacterium]|nr:hypothetical protein [Alphaproteobacteria bacterium]MBQ7286031.1 hypothetical protein [Alphaproteobacteria bacterium]
MTKQEIREEKVNQAIEKWMDMETSELFDVLNDLNQQEEERTEELTLIRALKKALKEVLADRDCEEPEEDWSNNDSQKSIPVSLY